MAKENRQSSSDNLEENKDNNISVYLRPELLQEIDRLVLDVNSSVKRSNIDLYQRVEVHSIIGIPPHSASSSSSAAGLPTMGTMGPSGTNYPVFSPILTGSSAHTFSHPSYSVAGSTLAGMLSGVSRAPHSAVSSLSEISGRRPRGQEQDVRPMGERESHVPHIPHIPHSVSHIGGHLRLSYSASESETKMPQLGSSGDVSSTTIILEENSPIAPHIISETKMPQALGSSGNVGSKMDNHSEEQKSPIQTTNSLNGQKNFITVENHPGNLFPGLPGLISGLSDYLMFTYSEIFTYAEVVTYKSGSEIKEVSSEISEIEKIKEIKHINRILNAKSETEFMSSFTDLAKFGLEPSVETIKIDLQENEAKSLEVKIENEPVFKKQLGVLVNVLVSMDSMPELRKKLIQSINSTLGGSLFVSENIIKLETYEQLKQAINSKYKKIDDDKVKALLVEASNNIEDNNKAYPVDLYDLTQASLSVWQLMEGKSKTELDGLVKSSTTKYQSLGEKEKVIKSKRRIQESIGLITIQNIQESIKLILQTERDKLSFNSFVNCAAQGNLEGVKKIYDSGAVDINAEYLFSISTDETKIIYHTTAMHEAAKSGSIELMQYLRDKGANIEDLQDKPILWYDLRETPLACAIKAGKTSAALWLIEKGADPVLELRSSMSPVFLAVVNSNIEVLKACETKINNFNVIFKQGTMVGVKVPGRSGNPDFSMLELALEKKLHDVVDFLTSPDHQKYVDELSKISDNAVITLPGHRIVPSFLVDVKETRTFNLLLERGICTPENIAKTGGLALYNAVKDSNIDLVEGLIRNGANKSMLNVLEFPIYAVKAASTLNFLLANGVCTIGNINNKDPKTGDTALHNAVNSGNSELVDALVRNGANPNIKNNNSMTANATLNPEMQKIFNGFSDELMTEFLDSFNAGNRVKSREILAKKVLDRGLDKQSALSKVITKIEKDAIQATAFCQAVVFLVSQGAKMCLEDWVELGAALERNGTPKEDRKVLTNQIQAAEKEFDKNRAAQPGSIVSNVASVIPLLGPFESLSGASRAQEHRPQPTPHDHQGRRGYQGYQGHGI